ncbi:MAG: hypothetical protein AAFY48_17790, partial [Bacteroidota bacterium]
MKFVFFLLLGGATLVGCDTENIDDTTLMPVFDCPDLEANYGDDCVTASGLVGFVNQACECESTVVEYDCPDLEANIGDDCS